MSAEIFRFPRLRESGRVAALIVYGAAFIDHEGKLQSPSIRLDFDPAPDSGSVTAAIKDITTGGLISADDHVILTPAAVKILWSE